MRAAEEPLKSDLDVKGLKSQVATAERSMQVAEYEFLDARGHVRSSGTEDRYLGGSTLRMTYLAAPRAACSWAPTNPTSKTVLTAMTRYAALAVTRTSGEETATTSSTAGRATTPWRATRFTKITLTSSRGATAMIIFREARARTSSTVGMARTSIRTSSIVAKARTNTEPGRTTMCRVAARRSSNPQSRFNNLAHR
jgi:hypothetical protein